MVELLIIFLGIFVLNILLYRFNNKTKKPSHTEEKQQDVYAMTESSQEKNQNISKYRKLDDYQDVLELMSVVGNSLTKKVHSQTSPLWNPTKEEVSSCIDNDNIVVLPLNSFIIKSMATFILHVTNMDIIMTDEELKATLSGDNVSYVAIKNMLEEFKLQVPTSSIKSVELIANQDDIMDAVLVVEFDKPDTAKIVKVMY